METERKQSTLRKIEENRKILQSLLKKKENLENNILQLENRIRNQELSLGKEQ